AYVMTHGGPQFATLFYILFLYQNAFEDFKMGYASALAWVLFLIVLAITLVQFKIANRWVFYEGELRK
ncbi:MAG TPA: ABC transporter permease, partial [Chloroflexota bacterium]